MLILVIKNPDKSCSFFYPEAKNNDEQSDQEWMKNEYARLLADVDEKLKLYPYEFIDSKDLPPKKYKDAIEWDSERDIHVNIEKFNRLEDERIYKERINKHREELITKMAIEELKTNGKLPADYSIEQYYGE